MERLPREIGSLEDEPARDIALEFTRPEGDAILIALQNEIKKSLADIDNLETPLDPRDYENALRYVQHLERASDLLASKLG